MAITACYGSPMLSIVHLIRFIAWDRAFVTDRNPETRNCDIYTDGPSILDRIFWLVLWNLRGLGCIFV